MLYRFLIVLLLITSPVGAADYSFTWDHNPPTDEVVNYRIWWKTEVQEYDELRTLHTGYVNEFTIYGMSSDRRCFVVTAIDGDGYESDYSNEVCSAESIRWKIR